MKQRSIHFSIVLVFSLIGSVHAQEIKIAGNRQHVIAKVNRDVVLQVAERYMASVDNEETIESSTVSRLQDPFTLEDETLMKEVAKGAVAPVKAEVVYEDSSILRAIANSLSQQIRGTLARGDIRYLQLQGGGLLKAGAAFPARIPQIKDQVFNVTLVEVDDGGFTLSLRDETLRISLSATSDRAVRFSE